MVKLICDKCGAEHIITDNRENVWRPEPPDPLFERVYPGQGRRLLLCETCQLKYRRMLADRDIEADAMIDKWLQ